MAIKMPRAVKSSMCQSCQSRFFFLQSRRSLSSSASRRADGMDAFTEALGKPRQPPRRTQQDRPAAELYKPAPSDTLRGIAQSATVAAQLKPSTSVSMDEPYHLNVYAHKHNIHITFTEPSRDPILSLSAGSIGLRKAQRGTYDAAYQLATFSFTKMVEKQWRLGGKKSNGSTQTMRDVNNIEVLLRGFGPGREAFQKALLGTEGRLIKDRIRKVTDGTRLKFGGVRSKKVRRL